MEGDYGWFSNGFHAAGKVLVEPCYNYLMPIGLFWSSDDALAFAARLFSSQDALGCEMLQSCANTVVSVPGKISIFSMEHMEGELQPTVPIMRHSFREQLLAIPIHQVN